MSGVGEFLREVVGLVLFLSFVSTLRELYENYLKSLVQKLAHIIKH